MNLPAIFRPIGARYLVLPDPVTGQETTVGDYTISTDTPHHKKAEAGTIIAMGKGCTEPMKPGDRVAFGKYSGYAQVVNGQEHKVLDEKELLGEWCAIPFETD